MQQRIFALLLLGALLMMALPVLAQDAVPDEQTNANDNALPLIDVTAIDIALTDDDSITATISSEPTHPSREPLPSEGCAPPPGAPIDHLLHRENNTITLDIFSAVPVGEAFCPAEEGASYQETFKLPGEFTSGQDYMLRVNNVAVRFDPQTLDAAAPSDAAPADDAPDDALFPPPSAPDTLLSAFPVTLETFEVIAGEDEATISLQLSGQIDGCDVDTYALTRPDFVAGDAVTHVEVFRAVSPAMACPAIVREYNTIIDTELPADANHVFVINDEYYRYTADSQTLQAVNRVDAVVEDVQITQTDEALEIMISGFHPDGCEADVQTYTHISENAVHVAFYRLLPVNIMCTKMLQPYETTLTLDAASENLPIVINGEQFPPVQNR